VHGRPLPGKEESEHFIFSQDFPDIFLDRDIFLLSGNRRMATQRDREVAEDVLQRLEWGFLFQSDLATLNDVSVFGYEAERIHAEVSAAPALVTEESPGGSDRKRIELRPTDQVHVYQALTNNKVDAGNVAVLNALPGPDVLLRAADMHANGSEVQGHRPAFMNDAPLELQLRPGCRLKVTVNLAHEHVPGGLVNGEGCDLLSIHGVVADVRSVWLKVRLTASGQVVDIGCYEFPPSCRGGASRFQLPVKLNWYSTFNGAQGTSFAAAITDATGIDDSKPGVLYTGALRSRSVAGTRIRNLSLAAVRAPLAALEFMVHLMERKLPELHAKYVRWAAQFLRETGGRFLDRVVLSALPVNPRAPYPPRQGTAAANAVISRLQLGSSPSPHAAVGAAADAADWQRQALLALTGGWRAPNAHLSRGGDGVARLISRMKGQGSATADAGGAAQGGGTAAAFAASAGSAAADTASMALQRLHELEGGTTGHAPTDTAVAAAAAATEAAAARFSSDDAYAHEDIDGGHGHGAADIDDGDDEEKEACVVTAAAAGGCGAGLDSDRYSDEVTRAMLAAADDIERNIAAGLLTAEQRVADAIIAEAVVADVATAAAQSTIVPCKRRRSSDHSNQQYAELEAATRRSTTGAMQLRAATYTGPVAAPSGAAAAAFDNRWFATAEARVAAAQKTGWGKLVHSRR